MKITVGVKGHEKVLVLDERFTDWFLACDKVDGGSPTLHIKFDRKTAFKDFDEQLEHAKYVEKELGLEEGSVHPSYGHFFIDTRSFESKDHGNPELDKNFVRVYS